MNQRVVTELVIDARGAVAGTAEYERAMTKASAAVDKVKQKSRDLRLDSNLPRSVNQVSAAYDRLRGSIDPVVRAQVRAQTEIRRAMSLVDRAVMTGVATQQQGAATISALRQKQIADINRVREAQIRLNATPTMPAGAVRGGLGGISAVGGGGMLMAGGGMLGPLAGVISGKQVADMADEWTAAGNQLRSVESITGIHVRTLSELNDIASETRSGFGETVSLYTRLTMAASKLVGSEQELADMTETINKSFKVGGKSASEQAAGILQLSQALGSGILQGDELRSLRENAPLIAQAIADEFGTTMGGLKKLGADGELTADRIIKAITNMRDKVDAAFAETDATIGDGITGVKNAGTELIGTFDHITGTSGALVGGLNSITKSMRDLSAAFSGFNADGSTSSFLALLKAYADTTAFGINMNLGKVIADSLYSVLPASEEARRAIVEIQADIATTMNKLAELDDGLFGGAFNHSEIKNAKDDLASLNAELERVQITGHAAFTELHRSAEDASMRALEAFQGLADGAVGPVKDAAAEFVKVAEDLDKMWGKIGSSKNMDALLGPLQEYIEKMEAGSSGIASMAVAHNQIPILASAAFRAAAGAADEGSAAYRRAKAEIDGLVEGLKTEGISANQVTNDLKGVEAALRAMGVGESVIAGLIASFGQLAARILNAKSNLDAYNNSQNTTSYAVPGATIGVSRGYAGPGGIDQPAYTGPDLGIPDSALPPPRTGSLYDSVQSIGKYAAGGTPSAGEVALVGEQGPEIVRFGAAATVSTASSTANILSGGASVLSMIEENTFQTVEQISRAVGYLETMENDGQTAISVLRQIKEAIGRSQISVGSSGGGSSSGSSSGTMGGFGGGSVDNPFSYVGGVFYPGNGGFDWRNYNAFQGGFQQQRTGLSGFATGGMIHPGDTQKVEFFKNPNERVIVARPDQYEDQRGGGGGSSSSKSVTIHVNVNARSNDDRRAGMEIADRVRQVVRAEMGGL